MPIALVAPGDPIPVAMEEPIKRGRGRPPGSKNKPKNTEPPVIESNAEPTLPAEEVLPTEDALPAEEDAIEPSIASSDPGDPPPPPKPRERKPRNPPAPPPPTPRERKPRNPPAPPPPTPRERKPRKVAPVPEERPETPPESPRSARSRLLGEYRAAQTAAHARRRDHFSDLLGRFMR